jgi:murein DD-endopeptidase MepM/ murein hydrolase activator NlpD
VNAIPRFHPGAVARLTAVAAVIVLVAAAPAYADPRGDKARVDAQLVRTGAALEAATARAQRAVAAYTAADARLPSARDALARARSRLASAQVEADRADRAAVAAADAAAQAGRRYAAARQVADQARVRFEQFVDSTYKGSGFLALDSILASGSPSELAVRLGYLDQIAESSQQSLDDLTAARAQAQARASATDAARRRAVDTRERARAAVVDARVAAATAERADADVRDLVAQRQDAVAAANQERAAVLARYARLKAESARIAAELRAAAARARRAARPARATAPTGGGAFFLMPTAGWKSSDFGMRYDPYYQVWQLHAGVDIAAPTGQAIYAAAAGRVVNSGWSGGYGRYTCISHGVYKGRDLATCYGHQSVILVSPGQWVRRGQMIGRVGSTGASTGSHLHFEVRRDGTPVDPLPWLPRCLC